MNICWNISENSKEPQIDFDCHYLSPFSDATSKQLSVLHYGCGDSLLY